MGSEQAMLADPGAEPQRVPLTVRDFLLLDEAGAFEGFGRVELVDGEVFTLAPLYFPHGQIQVELIIAIGLAARAVPGLNTVAPVSAELSEHSLPEADVLVVEGTTDRFVTAAMTRIAVEVAASSLRRDLGAKLRLYARAGIPEYWVADVIGRKIIRFHAPAGDTYAERAEFAFGEPVPSATLPGLTVETSRLA